MCLGQERSFILTICYLTCPLRGGFLQLFKGFTLQWMLASIHKHVNHTGYSTVNRFPSYFDKIPMNIASLLFENSYRIIFIFNLNNSVSKLRKWLLWFSITNKIGDILVIPEHPLTRKLLIYLSIGRIPCSCRKGLFYRTFTNCYKIQNSV